MTCQEYGFQATPLDDVLAACVDFFEDSCVPQINHGTFWILLAPFVTCGGAAFSQVKFPEEAKKAALKLPSEAAAYALKLLETSFSSDNHVLSSG